MYKYKYLTKLPSSISHVCVRAVCEAHQNRAVSVNLIFLGRERERERESWVRASSIAPTVSSIEISLYFSEVWMNSLLVLHFLKSYYMPKITLAVYLASVVWQL